MSAEGKDVVVIGGGDTGVDCVATALRQGARSVRQVIRAACPPACIDVASVWPGPRNVYVQGYGQREAEELFGEDPRIWSTDTLAFEGGLGNGAGLGGGADMWESTELGDGASMRDAAGLEDGADLEGGIGSRDSAGSVASVRICDRPDGGNEREIPAQLVLIAQGFLGPEQTVIDSFAPYANVHLAGDARLGSTLVATAIADGLRVASTVAENFITRDSPQL